MMTIKQIEVTVGEITRGYVNNDEQGVRGYNGLLDIRPPYQREFIYSEKEQQAVITTVLRGYPLNVMYWVKRSDDAECPYEVMDGQQRTLSLCEYVEGKYSYDFKNFFNQPADVQHRILMHPGKRISDSFALTLVGTARSEVIFCAGNKLGRAVF